MPTTVISVSPFPDVPQLPGVPQLVRSALFPPTPLHMLGTTASSALWAASRGLPTWGVFNDAGQQVVTPDNVYAFDNRNEWRLQDFPIQQGSFASYNKVVVPFEISLRFTKGGSQSDRTAFLQQIASIAGDLNLYTIITPEVSYRNCNVTRFEVTRRSSEGAYFLDEVDVFFRQVLEVSAQYSTAAANTANAQNPSALPPVNQGQVPPQAVPATVATAVSNAVAQAPN